MTDKQQTLYIVEKDAAYAGWVLASMTDGIHVDYTDGLTLEEYCTERGHDNVEAITWEQLTPRIEAYERGLCKAPERTNQDQWDHALNVLPPCKWTTYLGVEMFHVSERITNDLVDWYGRFGDFYFKWVGQSMQPESERAAAVIDAHKSFIITHDDDGPTRARLIAPCELPLPSGMELLVLYDNSAGAYLPEDDDELQEAISKGERLAVYLDEESA